MAKSAASSKPPDDSKAMYVGSHPDRIDQYRIVDVLGKGGMGVVYRAVQERLERDVALKVLHAERLSDQPVRRFEREARILAGLKHPGIAQVFDAGTMEWEGGRRPYFAMELIDGQPLNTYVHENQLTLNDRLELLGKVARALAYAHEQGVLHRDLKPANILVDDLGEPRILDFGVALMLREVGEQARETADGHITGTLVYMSPEQVAGAKDLDSRSDIYTLGVIAYEIISGSMPYHVDGKAVGEITRLIREQPPRPLSSDGSPVVRDVADIVRRALAKEPDKRYASATELATAIDQYLSRARSGNRREPRASQATGPQRKRVLAGAGTALALSVIVLGVKLLGGAGRGGGPAANELPSLIGDRPGGGSGIAGGELTDAPIGEGMEVVLIDDDDRGGRQLPEIDADEDRLPDENNIDPNAAKPGLAVITFKTFGGIDERSPNAGDTLARWLLAEIDTDNYRLYERSQLDAVLREKTIRQRPGLFDDEVSAVRIGRLAGIRYLVIGEVDYLDGEYGLTARVLDCLDGQLGERGTVHFVRLGNAKRNLPELVNLLGLRRGSGHQGADAPRLATGNELIDAFNPDADFSVTVQTTDRKTAYVEGEPINFVFETDRSCFLTVLTVDEEDNVVLLLPNRRRSQVFINAGDRVTVPPPPSHFPAEPPHGQSLVKVIATLKPLRLESLAREGTGTYEGLGRVDDNRMKRIGAQFGNAKAIGQEQGIGGDRDDVPVGLTATSWTTAELYVMTGSDEADLRQRLGRSEPPVVQPGEPPAPQPPYRDPEPVPIVRKPALRPVDPGSNPNDKMLDRWRALLPAAKGLGQVPLWTSRTAGDLPPVTELVVFRKPKPAGSKGTGGRGSMTGEISIVPVGRGGVKGVGDPDVIARIRELRQDPDVAAVVPNLNLFVPFAAPESTTLRPLQWSLHNEVEPGRDTAWTAAYDKLAAIETPLIGVVDEGMHVNDPRLRDLAWHNDDEIAGNGIDDDGNGFVDDIHGWNFLLDSPQMYSPTASFNHGSYCSSIIGARPVGSETDVLGIAPRSKVAAAVVLDSEQTTKGATPLPLVGALEYLAQQGAKVINISLGSDPRQGELPPEIVQNIVDMPIWKSLEDRGIILVVAAGNSATNNDEVPVLPANLPNSNVITVMAIDAAAERGRLYNPMRRKWEPYSCYGAKTVEIAAPGSLIVGIPEPGRVGAVEESYGTSYATPMVTAAVALVWGQHPNWDYKTVIRAVLESARTVESLKGQCTTGGMLDIEAALNWTPDSRP